jgi:hypothetical protein
VNRRAVRCLAGALLALLLAPAAALAQGEVELREFVGHLGGRRVLLVLTSAPLADGTLRVSGEYLVLATLQRRFLEGERSPKIGVTTLREGSTPIFFGRPATATLQGSWRDGTFTGTRLGPGGQVREKFEFSDAFPSMEAYGAALACDASDDGYRASAAYTIEQGKLKPGTLSWRARVEPGGHSCAIAPTDSVEQVPVAGGLRFIVGRTSGQAASKPPQCAVTLRDLGDHVRIAAENCAAFCGSQAYFEPLLVDRRARCQLLRPQPR